MEGRKFTWTFSRYEKRIQAFFVVFGRALVYNPCRVWLGSAAFSLFWIEIGRMKR